MSRMELFLEMELAAARKQLCWAWENFKSCACGARRNSLRTHPHGIGCPTEKAWWLEHGGAPEKEDAG